MTRLQTKREGLIQEDQPLVTFIDDRTLLSPTDNLTDDALQEIFYHCLDTINGTSMSIHEPPLSLGLVCRRWRLIAYSTPKLWTSLHIIATPLATPLNCRNAAWMKAILSWLSRSGVLPLSISISTSNETTSMSKLPTNSQIQPYLDLIALHAHRWRHLHFRLYRINWVDLLSRIRSTDVPLLEHLHIEEDFSRSQSLLSLTHAMYAYTLDTVSPLAQDHGILRARHLRSLTLPCHLLHGLRAHLQWQRLTSLNLINPEISQLFEVLNQCRNLVTCAIDFNNDTISIRLPPQSNPNTSLTMPNLQKLSIIAEPRKDSLTSRILNNLNAPSLVHFLYERKRSSGWDDTCSLINHEERIAGWLGSFINRVSHQKLEALDFWFDPVSDRTIPQILRRSVRIKRISLTGRLFPNSWPHSAAFNLYTPRSYFILPASTVPLDDSLLSLLTPTITEPIRRRNYLPETSIFDCLCPHLEFLCLSDISLSHEVLLKFVRSRTVDHSRQGFARLHKLDIHFSSCYPGKEGDSGEIRLQQQIMEMGKVTGLQVRLHYPPSVGVAL